MILREAGLMVLLGMVIGLLAAVATSRLTAAWLYGLSTFDPLTFSAAACILGGVALMAAYIPAARAARVNPTEALRHE